MSDQDENAMARLNHAIKVAEGASKRRDDGFRLRKIHAQIAKEGFPRFKNLPPEIRSKIWQDAMPPYGIYTVLMLGREEPMPQQPAAPAPVAFRVAYRLESVPRDQQDDELRTRLDIMRAIQSVSSEAAYEVQRAFPTTIDCTGGKLRFNAMHDILNLSDLQCILGSGFLRRFRRYARGAVVFANDWHKVPRTMLFNNRTLWIAFFRGAGGIPPGLSASIQRIKGFLDFLADCTNLKTVGLTYDAPVMRFYKLVEVRSNGRLPFSLLAPAMNDPFYERSWLAHYHGVRLPDFVEGVEGVEALTHGLDPARRVPTYLQSVTFRHPTLQDLEFLTAVPGSSSLRHEALIYKREHVF